MPGKKYKYIYKKAKKAISGLQTNMFLQSFFQKKIVSNLQQDSAGLVVFPSHGIIVHDGPFAEIHHLKHTVEGCWHMWVHGNPWRAWSKTKLGSYWEEQETHRQAPVHAQVNGDQQDVFRKDVGFFGPAPYSAVTTLSQLGIEERVKRIDWGKVGPLAALHQQIHVEVDHLRSTLGRLSVDWTHNLNSSAPKWWRSSKTTGTHFIVEPVETTQSLQIFAR